MAPPTEARPPPNGESASGVSPAPRQLLWCRLRPRVPAVLLRRRWLTLADTSLQIPLKKAEWPFHMTQSRVLHLPACCAACWGAVQPASTEILICVRNRGTGFDPSSWTPAERRIWSPAWASSSASSPAQVQIQSVTGPPENTSTRVHWPGSPDLARIGLGPCSASGTPGP